MTKCKKHPRYRAKRQPRSDCVDCWRLWRERGYTDDARAFVRGLRQAQKAVNK